MDDPIDIPDSGDRTFGFLSNDWMSSFEVEGVRWPSVTHYVEGKKFEGTQYEDEIRSAKTILQVKSKTRMRESILIKEHEDNFSIERTKIYGKKNRCLRLRTIGTFIGRNTTRGTGNEIQSKRKAKKITFRYISTGTLFHLMVCQVKIISEIRQKYPFAGEIYNRT